MARRQSAEAEAERELGRGTISGVYLKAEQGEVPAEQRSLADHLVILGASPASRHLISALRDLRERLCQQFRNEEAPDGLFSEVLAAAPWLEPRVEALRREHTHICALCERLVEDVGQRPRRATMHAVFNVLIHSLREHDDFEHALVQEAMNAELDTAW